ncbi:TetR family transcriptional regulator C-terminal domain-containing protein [Streptomyces sp. NBC_00868]|uniref:TetR family transcriptional regulator C-terminal domain-containing protein n=1 Tax=unclassified Streptomyces TaxID=2593676 RepID=UPI00324C4FCB|nr:TetR family transcriptional regulator C-terminal domain-containing protein [Streptomyces sp. NBC_00868]
MGNESASRCRGEGDSRSHASEADHEGLAQEAHADGELEGAWCAGGLPAAMDVELESTRLAALLDGLTLQATLLPDRYPPTLLRQVLRRHLDALKGCLCPTSPGGVRAG